MRGNATTLLHRHPSRAASHFTDGGLMSNYKIGYARVSTLQQDEALQLDVLRAADVDRRVSTRPPASWSPDRP